MEGGFTLAYLGSSILSKGTTSGLGTIQKPLREKYFEYKKASGKKSKAKELSEVGLHVDANGIGILTAGSHPGTNELFYDMSSVSFFEAVRFTTVKGTDKKLQAGFVPIDINRSPNTGSEKLFSPLDKKYHAFSKMNHSAILALVMRKTTGVRALECHAFICESEQEALQIVALIGALQMRRSDYGPRADYQRQDSDPRYDPQMGPPRRPDLIQTEFGEFGVYRGGPRPMNLSNDHFRGSQRNSDNLDQPGDLDGAEQDRYMGNAPRDLRDSRGNYMGPGPFGQPPEMYNERKFSGELDRFGPDPGFYDGNEEVRFRHERQRSSEIRHERQSSGEMNRRSSDYRHERQRSSDVPPVTDYRHERQRSSELSAMPDYRHERQRSGEIAPRMDERPGFEYGRQGRSESRHEGGYGHTRVMSPGRVPPATAPKPSRALSPGPGPRTSQEMHRNQPPMSPREQRGPPMQTGPEYSISSLESRQEIENRPKPVARVPPHLVAGVKVLPTGFQAALQKKQESPRSPRNSRNERDYYGEDGEGPYDNAVSRREFYDKDYRRLVKSETETYHHDHDRDLHRNAPPDVLPRDAWDQQRLKQREFDEDYERVVRREPGYNQNVAGGKGNRFSAPPDEHVGAPQKLWSYEEQLQKYSKERDQEVTPSGGYKDNKISSMFSNLNVHNQAEKTNFEKSLGYFP